MTTEKTQKGGKGRRADVYHDSDMDTPSILSEVSSEADNNYMSNILLTERC